jgi:DNA-binding CsgD family transcriptional regulator
MNAAAAFTPGRLRVAVVASGAAAESRFIALLHDCGHELVEAEASPDVILTDGAADALSIAAAVGVGAVDAEFAGALPAEASAVQIDAALRAVAAGLTVRAAGRQGANFGPLPEEAPVLLTHREIEVLAALGNGLSNKAAARQLGISPHTVKFHIESIFKKLAATSRAEAVAKGLKRQIVEF